MYDHYRNYKQEGPSSLPEESQGWLLVKLDLPAKGSEGTSQREMNRWRKGLPEEVASADSWPRGTREGRGAGFSNVGSLEPSARDIWLE